MTLAVIFFIFSAGVIINSSAKTPSNTNNELRNSNLCLEANIVCPAVDGQDSIYAPLPDCTKFCQCSNGVPVLHNCPVGLHFNPTLNVCDWPQNAGCTSGNTTSTEAVTTTEATTTTTSATTTTTAVANITQPSNSDNICIQNNVVCPALDGPDSVYASLPDCTKFCQCSNGVPVLHNCPVGLHFNPTLNVCDWPQNAGCTGGSTTSTEAATTTEATTTTTYATNTTAIVANITQPSNSDNICIQNNVVCPAVDGQDSVYASLPDCTKFCQCSNGVSVLHNCPVGLHFNPTLNVCDWPQNAGCTGASTTSTEAATTTEATTTTTYATNSTATVANITQPSNSDNICIQNNVVCPAVDGQDSVYAPLPDCTKFCQCSNGVPVLHNCPVGLHFNPTLNVCDWPQNAGCTGGSTTSTEAVTTTEAATTTTSASTTTTAVANITQPSNSDNICIQSNVVCPAVDGPDSVYASLPDCTKFCQCSNGVPVLHNCPVGLHFNPTLNVCDWPQNAGCSGGSTTSTEAATTTEATTTTTSATYTTATVANITQPSNSDNICIQNNVVCPAVDGSDSVYASLPDCTKFCQCSNGVPVVQNCPVGLHFNQTLNVCDWPQNAGCTGGSTTSTEAVTTTEAATTTTSATTTTAPVANITQPSNSDNICIQNNVVCPAVDGPDSVYASLPDCTKFCQCSNGVPVVHNCPVGLHFNPTLNVCDWPQNAGCTGGSTTSTEAVTTTEAATTTTSATTTTAAVANITQPSNSDNICIQNNVVCPAVDGPDSVYASLPDCTKFCQCSNGVPVVQNCPVGLHFNPTLNVCDWPQNAGCTVGSTTSTQAATTTEATTTTTSATTTTAAVANITQSSNSDNICIQNNVVCPAVDGSDSVYASLPDCTKFCQCSNGVPVVQNCPVGLHFNPTLNVCDWPQNAGCTGGSTTSTEAVTTTEAATTTTSATTTTAPVANITQPSNSDNICIQNNVVCPAVDGPDSVYASLPDCTKFCQCSNGVPVVHNCPVGLHFNPTLNVCDWPQNAGCTGGSTTSTEAVTTTEAATTTTSATTTTAAVANITQPSNSDNICIQNNVVCPAVDGSDSVYASLPDCTKFCQCSNGVPVVHNCPVGLHFNPTLNVCDWPQNAGCTGGSTTSTEAVTTTEAATTTTSATTTTAAVANITQPSNSDNICIQNNVVCPAVDGSDSVYASLPDCTKFCQCSNGVPVVQNCPVGLHFNPTLKVCDWPQNAGCTGGSTTSTEAVTTTEATTTTTSATAPEDVKTTTDNSVVDDNDSSVESEYTSTDENITESNKEESNDNITTENNDNTTEESNEVSTAEENNDDTTEESNEVSTAEEKNDDTTEDSYEVSTTEENNDDTTEDSYEGSTTEENNDDTTEVSTTEENNDDTTEDSYEISTTEDNNDDTTEDSYEVSTTEENNDDTTEDSYEVSTTEENNDDTSEVSTTEENNDDTTKDSYEVSTTEENNDDTTEDSYEVSTTEENNDDNTEDSYEVSPTEENNDDTTEVSTAEENNDDTTEDSYEVSTTEENNDDNTEDSYEVSTTEENNDDTTEVRTTEENNDENATESSNDDYTTEEGSESENETTEETEVSTNISIEPTPCDTVIVTETVVTTTVISGSEYCLQNNIICTSEDEIYLVYSALPDCTKFCQCSNGLPQLRSCPDDLHFNSKLNVCDSPENSGCSLKNGTTTTISPNMETTTSTECTTGTTAEPREETTLDDETTAANVETTEYVEETTADETTEAEEGQEEVTTAVANITQPSNSDNICIQNKVECLAVDGPDSVYASLPDCTKFCQCSNGIPVVHNCPTGLHFNPTLNVCDWPQNAGCNGGSTEGDGNVVSTTEENNDDTTEDSYEVSTPEENNDDATSEENVETTTDNSVVDDNDSTVENEVSENAGTEGEEAEDERAEEENASDDVTLLCLNHNVVCPAVDGDHPVYSSLPDCTKFCQCSNGTPYLFDCPKGLHFNPTLNVCDYPENAGCQQNS